MTEHRARRHKDTPPSHPGKLLRDVTIPATGRSQSEIARLLKTSRQNLVMILRGERPVTADMAVRLGKLFGNGPDLWIGMQAAYDVWHAERNVDVSDIQTIEARAA